MGTEALWVPLAIAAAGAGVNQYNINRTAKKQDAETARGIIKQSRIQDESNAELNKTLNFAESSSPEKHRAKLQNDFLNSILSAKSKTGIDQVGDLSDAFRTGAAASNQEAVDFASDTGGLFARMDAPGLQRQAEGFRFGDNAMDIARLKGQSQQEEFLSALRVKGIRPNPWLSILAGGLQGAATGVAANKNRVEPLPGGFLNPRHPDFVGPPDPRGIG